MTVPVYKLHAYICGRSCIKLPTFDGWAPLESIFQMRPDGCRYGVAQMAEPEYDGEFCAWDFYDDRLIFHIGPDDFPQIDPIEIWSHVDGLIMRMLHRCPS